MKKISLFVVCLLSFSTPSIHASIEVNGFLHSAWVAASNGVDSFSQPNLTAFTAAGHPLIHTAPSSAQTSFQMGQSRIGLVFKPDEEIATTFEFDFIDFSKASPTTAAVPRVRKAVMEYTAAPSLQIFFGQDWDIVSPLNPYTYNPVGNYFEAGNIAFMRIQLGAKLNSGDVEHAIAIGLPGNNSSASDGTLETGIMPTIAIRETLKLSTDLKVGLSGLGVFLQENTTTSDRYFAGAVNAFAEWGNATHYQLKSELYLGQNTVNIGMLGLAFATATSHAVKEAGGYLTLHSAMNGWGWFIGVGAAKILNPSEMSASYTGTPGAYTKSSNGPGIESNATARVGAEIGLTKHADIFLEFAEMWTRYRLQASDVATVDPDRQSSVFQAGMKVRL